MARKDTALRLAEAFVALTETRPFDKVSVSDVIDATGKNRKTFYYHFMDKEHLVRWLFRHDLDAQLRTLGLDDNLVFEDPSDDPCSRFAYYARVPRGVRSLDGRPFFGALAATLEGRRAFYAKALQLSDAGNLRDYLYQLYLPAIRQDVVFILKNRHMSEDSLAFLAEYHTGSFLHLFVHRCCDPHCQSILHGSGPFQNLMHDSIENDIREQQLHRPR